MSEIIQAFQKAAEQKNIHVGTLYEKTVQKIYEAWLNPGDFAIDVGAHKGAHLFPMAEAVGPKGKIYAFEPIDKLYLNLQRDVKKRRIKNVKLHRLALGLEAGNVTFSYFENRPAFSGLQHRVTPFSDVEGGLQEVKVKCVTLDSCLPFFRKISAIKLDIEGGELHALMGARRCLQKSRPLVVFENGREASAKVYDYRAEDFFSFFEAMEMRLFWLSGEPFTPDQWRSKTYCWEFVALPNEKEGFSTELPALCQQVMAEL